MVRMSRRRFLGKSVAALGSLLAAACDLRPASTPQSESLGTATAVPPRPQEVVPARAAPPQTVRVLVIWSEWLDAHRGVLGLLAEEFTDRHPPLTVDWQPIPLTHDPDSASPGQQVEQLHSAGLLFDVVQLPLDFTSHLFIGDAAVDLYPYIRSDKYDLADYWPGAIEASQWRGKLYGLHAEVRPTVLHCNEALFTQAGLGIPTTAWTWPQFRDAVKQLTDRQQPKPIFGFGFDLGVRSTLPWLWANGGAMLSADRSESLVARPEAQEALQWLHELTRTQAVTLWEADFSRANDLNVWELFRDGRIAMLNGFWIDEVALAQALGHTLGFSIAMVEPPRGPRQSASYLDEIFGAYHLSKSARVPDDAWRFLSWWTSAETQRRYQAESDGFIGPPARRSLAGEFADRYGAATLAALAYGRPLPLHPKWHDLMQAYDQGLLPVWKGEATVAEATAAIASEQNAILAEWRRKQQQRQQGRP